MTGVLPLPGGATAPEGYPPAPQAAAVLHEFIAFGKPAPQGSKTRNRYGGVRNDNAERLEPWRNAVMGAVLNNPPPDRIEGPVFADLTFTFDKPTSAPKTRRIWPVKRSTFDLDKLCRAVFDALTAAGCWRDDAQVVELTARKVFVGDQGALLIPGARIVVWQVTP